MSFSVPQTPEERTAEHLNALSAHLEARREAILVAWRHAAAADPAQTTVSSLTRAQFNDHIPQLLEAFDRKLRARPGGTRAAAADQVRTNEEVKHGLQRWQQGYRLSELMHEWGHLHFALIAEIDGFTVLHPEIERATLSAACHELTALIHEGINESASQYARMQQAESAGHVRDLQRAVEDMTEIERRRAELIHQAVHDLRGNVQSVSTAAEVLQEADIAEAERVEFAELVQQGIDSVSAMLGELMELARLEAGQDERKVAPFDVTAVLAELCATTQPVAGARKLFLKTVGPETLQVEGDAPKVRRLLQNLLFNALKYTEHGGVTMTWGEGKESWWVTVKDTGPGMLAGPSSPITTGLKEATASARETDQAAANAAGEAPSVLPLPVGGTVISRRPTRQPAGEGIGLSIVKRLCELLDASLELASSAETDTTFRVVFPSHYAGPSVAPGRTP